jgi:hypothetical protein
MGQPIRQLQGVRWDTDPWFCRGLLGAPGGRVHLFPRSDPCRRSPRLQRSASKSSSIDGGWSLDAPTKDGRTTRMGRGNSGRDRGRRWGVLAEPLSRCSILDGASPRNRPCYPLPGCATPRGQLVAESACSKTHQIGHARSSAVLGLQLCHLHDLDPDEPFGARIHSHPWTLRLDSGASAFHS